MRVCDAAKIDDFVGGGLDAARVASKSLVRGSDQREIPLERQREHDPPVARLHDIAAIVVEQAPHHDVAALVESRRKGGAVAQRAFCEQLQPGAGGIDEDTGGREVAPASHLQHQAPFGAALRADAARTGADHGAALRGIERGEHHETRVVGKAIRIFEAEFVTPLERRAERISCEIDDAGRRKDLPSAKVVIDEQSEPQHPGRTQTRFGRQHEAHGPDQVRRHAQHHFALEKCLAHQPQPSLLEVAQPAMDQLGRGRRRSRCEVVLLDQQNAQAPPGGIAGNACAIDTAADNGEIEFGHTRSIQRER